MSEEENKPVEKTAEEIAAEAVAAADAVWKEKMEAMAADNERLNAKIAEANKHTKAAEAQAAKEAREKAAAEGNFKQLYESSEAARLEAEEARDKINQLFEQQNINDIAGTIALKLNPIEAAVSDLKSKIASRLKYSEDGVKVTDKKGNLTISTIEQLTEELKGSADYSYMLKGNQSSGGSANGGSNGSGASGDTIKRADFEALNPAQRQATIKRGAKVI